MAIRIFCGSGTYASIEDMLLCIHVLTNPMCMFQLVSRSEKREGEIPCC